MSQSIVPSRLADEFPPGPAMDRLLAHLPVGIVVVDADGNMVYMNETARATLGTEVDASPGTSRTTEAVDRTVPAADASMEWIMARAALTGEVVRDEEVRYVNQDGTPGWFSVSATPLVVAGEAIGGAVLTFADVTATRLVREWQPLINSLRRL